MNFTLGQKSPNLFWWRGFEPSGFVLINDNYVALASSSKSEFGVSLRVGFVGTSKLKSELKWNVEITWLKIK